MTKYYCFGKQGVCNRISCSDCEYFNGRGGENIEVEDQNILKPCPFCGGEAKIEVIEKGVKSIIYCTSPECGFERRSFNNGDTDENAALRLATAWNRRSYENNKKA